MSQYSHQLLKLNLEKEIDEVRGKIDFFSFGNKKIYFVETRKSYARGGHYHSFPSIHILISGLIEYREENIDDNQEHIKKIQAPAIINTPPNFAHLIIALEDSVFIEIFEQSYEATNYEKYRKIVDEKLQRHA